MIYPAHPTLNITREQALEEITRYLKSASDEVIGDALCVLIRNKYKFRFNVVKEYSVDNSYDNYEVGYLGMDVPKYPLCPGCKSEMQPVGGRHFVAKECYYSGIGCFDCEGYELPFKNGRIEADTFEELEEMLKENVPEFGEIIRCS